MIETPSFHPSSEEDGPELKTSIDAGQLTPKENDDTEYFTILSRQDDESKLKTSLDTGQLTPGEKDAVYYFKVISRRLEGQGESAKNLPPEQRRSLLQMEIRIEACDRGFNSPDPSVRAGVARGMLAPAAFPDLMSSLFNDPDPKVRAAAAENISCLRLPGFTRLFRDTDPKVRSALARNLFIHEASRKDLKLLFTDASEEVRIALSKNELAQVLAPPELFLLLITDKSPAVRNGVPPDRRSSIVAGVLRKRNPSLLRRYLSRVRQTRT